MFTIKDNSIIFDYNFNDELLESNWILIIKNYQVLEFKIDHYNNKKSLFNKELKNLYSIKNLIY